MDSEIGGDSPNARAPLLSWLHSFLSYRNLLFLRRKRRNDEEQTDTADTSDLRDPWNWSGWFFNDGQRSQIITALFSHHLHTIHRHQLLSYLLSLQTEHPHRTSENQVFDIRVLGCVVELTNVGNERVRQMQVSEDISINSIIEECYLRDIFQSRDESRLREREECVVSTLEIASMLSFSRNVNSAANQPREAFDLLGFLKQSHDEAVQMPIKTLFANLGYLPVTNTRTLDEFYEVDSAIECKDLNATVITAFGGLKIKWVSDFGDHLFLNTASGHLSVFWHAAICKAIADGSAGFFLQLGIPQHFAEEILRTYWILFGSSPAAKCAYLSLPAPNHLRRLLPSDHPSHSISIFNSQSWRPYDIPLHLCSTGYYDREIFNAVDFPYFA
ncbi:hypothetical protein K440DRAFT_658775, partial [Wilcoxina mikolae CBS 423.85]